MITIKIGGSVVDDLHTSVIQDIKKTALERGLIIVHGGAKEVSSVSKQLGKEPKFVTSPSGIKSRYTDAQTSEIFTMVMAGRIGKNIVRILQKNGINAVGLSGIDGRLIQAERKKRLLIINEKGRKQVIDGGYTGRITNVNSSFIEHLVKNKMVPLITMAVLRNRFTAFCSASLSPNGINSTSSTRGAKLFLYFGLNVSESATH